MSKKSFNDIENLIKNAVEANEPAFKEASWSKMEVLLDKEKDRKRPFIFWLWLLIPVLIITGGVGYFTLNKNGNRANTALPGKTINADPVVAAQQNDLPKQDNTTGTPQLNNTGTTASSKPAEAANTKKPETGKNRTLSAIAAIPVTKKAGAPSLKNDNAGNKDELRYSKNKLAENTRAKLKGSVIPAAAEVDDDLPTIEQPAPVTVATGNNSPVIKQGEEVVVVKIETVSKDDKEIEKLIDSVIDKTVNDKKEKTKISRFFIIVAAGAEGSGTKLFSADKITGRAGLAAGYNLNQHLSVQAGFFMSNKKYKAEGNSYKTKPGTYWNIVDIKEVEANCRVYEIPVQVNYNFTPGKKLNIFGSVGLSSYIMKKEDYSFYYSRYGTYHKADAYYSGNKSLFSVLRISGGVEKKVGKQFSLFASPALSIPLAGVGEGEVKLYSAEILIGLKFTPARRNK